MRGKFLRRKDAAAYIKEKYGFGSPGALAKLACVGGGPEYQYMGDRIPVYVEEKLDEWALSKLSKPVASTSQKSEALPPFPRTTPLNSKKPGASATRRASSHERI